MVARQLSVAPLLVPQQMVWPHPKVPNAPTLKCTVGMEEAEKQEEFIQTCIRERTAPKVQGVSKCRINKQSTTQSVPHSLCRGKLSKKRRRQLLRKHATPSA